MTRPLLSEGKLIALKRDLQAARPRYFLRTDYSRHTTLLVDASGAQVADLFTQPQHEAVFDRLLVELLNAAPDLVAEVRRARAELDAIVTCDRCAKKTRVRFAVAAGDEDVSFFCRPCDRKRVKP